MQIQQPLISVLNQTQGNAQQLLEKLAVGEVLEAVVVKSNSASESAVIRLVDTLLRVTTSEPLIQGQKMLLERVLVEGKDSFKLIRPESAQFQPVKQAELEAGSTSIKLGQRVAVDVVKQLTPSTFLMSSSQLGAKQNFEVDVSKLSQQVKVGNKMALEVLNLKPLQVKLINDVSDKILTSETVMKPLKHFFQQPVAQATPTPNQVTGKHLFDKQFHIGERNQTSPNPAVVQSDPSSVTLLKTPNITLENINKTQYITTKIHQLVQQQVQPPSLSKTLALLNQDKLPVAIKLISEQIIKSTLDSTVLTHQGVIKQALMNSGQFIEAKLRMPAPSVKQDLKVNIVKALDVITATLNQQKTNSSSDTVSLVNKLPAHSQSTWMANGRTPAQLLSVLMNSTERPSVFPTLTSPLTPVLQTPEQASLLTQMLTQSSNSQSLPRLELLALFREAEHLHSKIQLNQLLNVREQDGSVGQQNTWIFDLPIKNKEQLDFIQLLLSRDKNKQNELEQNDSDIWDVRLRLDTQNLGPLSAEISLHGDDVQVTLTAQNPASSELLSQYLPELEASLTGLGVNVIGAHCLCGHVADMLVNPKSMEQNSSPFVDISV